jgi:hypothetical protein
MTLTTPTMERAHHAAMAGDETTHDHPVRRTHPAAYKLAILAEYEAATEEGARGAILRREGLYTSHITDWRRARDAGALAGLDAAYAAHPERFVNKHPVPPRLPGPAWINPPKEPPAQS